MKISIAFYKGKGNFINAIVRWWTKSIYSHAEIVLSDGTTWVGISPFLKSEVNGRDKPHIDVEEWDFINLDIDKDQYNTVIEFYNDTRGHKYDWIGMLLSQFLPCRIKHKSRWYCSEWITYALRIACVLDWKTLRLYERKELSPATLHSLLTKNKHIKI